MVLCIETSQQITDIQRKLIQTRNHDGQRFILPPLNQAAVESFIVQSTLPRLYILALFNTFIEESIAIISILSLLFRFRRLFIVMLTLLTIIWFIEQYRIADLNHHMDSIDFQSSTMIITSHLMHFGVIILGAISLLTNTKDRLNNEISTINKSTGVNGTAKFVNIEPSIIDEMEKTKSNANLGQRFKKRCDWMHSTFVKRSNGKNKSPNGATSGGDDSKLKKSETIEKMKSIV